MAVTVTITRTAHSDLTSSEMEYVSMALSGTYATGGFTYNPFAVVAGPGTSPLTGQRLRFPPVFFSPTGYIYATTITGTTATTKILTAPNTELANNTAVPDAVVPGYMMKAKL